MDMSRTRAGKSKWVGVVFSALTLFWSGVVHAATVSLGDATATAAQAGVALPLTLSVNTAEQITAVSLDVQFDPVLAQWNNAALESSVVALGKQVTTYTLSAGHVRLIIYGLDRQLLSSGPLGQCLLNVASTAPQGSILISLSTGSASDPNGIELPVVTYDGRLWVELPTDTAAPQISAVLVSAVTADSAIVSWVTDEPATSQVEYGLSASYGFLTAIDPVLSLNHSVSLAGLSAATTYHVRVRSVDLALNQAVGADVAFTTQALPAAAAPVFSPSGGTFSNSVTVGITSATSGAAIRYTMDGTDPTAASSLYSQPLVFTTTTTLKARSFKSDMSDSAVTAATYTLSVADAGEIPAANASALSSGWTVYGTDRAAWNANNWLEFSQDFGSGGTWGLKLAAINQNSSSAPGLPSGYAFNIAVSVDGAAKGSFPVPGSTTTYQTGSANFPMPSGIHTVRFTWTNDAWLAGLYDANIRVRGVAFVPPATTTSAASYDFTASQASPTSGGWKKAATERYAYSANEWLEFQNVDFGAGGSWVISATATNQNRAQAPGLPSGYAYVLNVYVDGVMRTSFQVPGSTTLYRTGSTTLNLPSGRHSIRLLWANDVYSAGQYDSNIRVQSVNMRVGQ